MLRKELSDLISKIEPLTGPLIYDEEEFKNQIDVDDWYSFWLDDYIGIGLEIDSSLSRISLFRSFGYSDITKSDIEKGVFDPEEIELENREFLIEKCFTVYLKSHSPDFLVSTWDDGCYMCPGYTSLVGFNDLPLTKALISCFISSVQSFDREMGDLSDIELRQYLIKKICHEHGICVTSFDRISLGHSSYLYLCQTLTDHDEIVTSYYSGKEYFFFKAFGKNYVAENTPINIFRDMFEISELYDDIGIYYGDGMLKFSSKNMMLCVSPIEDTKQQYAQTEELFTIISSSAFLPFASEKFKKTFTTNYQEHADNTPLIMTEGHTDWKHLKKHWLQLKHEFPGMNLSFNEYEASNSKDNETSSLEMGSSNLYETCRAYSRWPLGRTFIFIADRDEPSIIRKMGGEVGYKDWGNGVYSLVLPVPKHRTTTPEICIEHYYTDTELKKKYTCDDGVARCLYLGNDFDHYGRNTNEKLLCTKRNLCGTGSIKIIDGSSDCRVISSESTDETNYALSKSDFALFASPDKSSASFDAFRGLFKLIYNILFH